MHEFCSSLIITNNTLILKNITKFFTKYYLVSENVCGYKKKNILNYNFIKCGRKIIMCIYAVTQFSPDIIRY